MNENVGGGGGGSAGFLVMRSPGESDEDFREHSKTAMERHKQILLAHEREAKRIADVIAKCEAGGVVTISARTTLSADMYCLRVEYDGGGTINTNGYHIIELEQMVPDERY